MLALFGLAMAIAYKAPLAVWAVGFLCVYIDNNETTRNYCNNCY